MMRAPFGEASRTVSMSMLFSKVSRVGSSVAVRELKSTREILFWVPATRLATRVAPAALAMERG